MDDQAKMEHIAHSMGIALYQRFTLQEASLFLRCSQTELNQLINQDKINHIQVTAKKHEFFGYQLLEYILSQTTNNPIQPAQQQHPSSIDHILRAKEVQAMTGLSRTTLWRMENKGEFPRRVSLGTGSVGWRQSEVHAWQASRKPV